MSLVEKTGQGLVLGAHELGVCARTGTQGDVLVQQVKDDGTEIKFEGTSDTKSGSFCRWAPATLCVPCVVELSRRNEIDASFRTVAWQLQARVQRSTT